jgi:hypothetical protein
MNKCKCLKKLYSDDNGFYVKCIYCEEESERFKYEEDALKLKRKNIKEKTDEKQWVKNAKKMAKSENKQTEEALKIIKGEQNEVD